MVNRHLLRRLTVCLVALLVACAQAGNGEHDSLSDAVAALGDRESITILVTDSGLGGLSVAAAVARQFDRCHPFAHVRLIFANALPDNDHTYNAMASTAEKADVFTSALDGFVDRFQPDIILIACNTLSIVYPETEFSSRSNVPVFGIVEFGVRSIRETLTGENASAIIMGTPTTAESHAHKDALIEQSVHPDRITTHACEMLESEIQADPNSDVVRTMIEMYAVEALESNPPVDSSDVTVALCCSHYGYARSAFEDVFRELLGHDVSIVDPNDAMSAAVLAEVDCTRFENTQVAVEVVSRAELGEDDIASIAAMLQAVSAVTAEALRTYTLDTNLFTY